MSLDEVFSKLKMGQGNFGHSGRPGHRGGSAPGTGGGGETSTQTYIRERNAINEAKADLKFGDLKNVSQSISTLMGGQKTSRDGARTIAVKPGTTVEEAHSKLLSVGFRTLIKPDFADRDHAWYQHRVNPTMRAKVSEFQGTASVEVWNREVGT